VEERNKYEVKEHDLRNEVNAKAKEAFYTEGNKRRTKRI
jgi:hypothetical protein